MASSTDRRSENSTSSERDVNLPSQGVRSVVICGASVRSLAESAFQSGFRPLCIDFFGDADLRTLLKRRRSRMVASIDSFSQLAKSIRYVRSNIPVMWAGGLENHIEILHEIARSRRLIGPDLSVVEQLRNPFVFSGLMKHSGLQTPWTSTSPQGSDRLWLRKSLSGSGGLGVRLPGDQQKPACDDAMGDGYYQEYVDGIPMSATFVGTSHGCRLIGIALQFSGWPGLGASGFQFCGNAGPVNVTETLTKEVRHAGQVIHAYGLHGAFGLDFILQKGRVWFLEVNPRITASHLIHEQTQPGLNLVREHMSAFGFKPAVETSSRSSNAPGKLAIRAVIWTARHATQSSAKSLLRQPEWKVSERLRFTDIPASPEHIVAGMPLCSVEVTGDSLQEICEDILCLANNRRYQNLCEWPTVAETLGAFWKRFELNLFEERRRQIPPRNR